MWRLPRLENEIISIACTADSLTCSWIQPSRTTWRYTLKAHRYTPLAPGTVSRSGIFNPTLLVKHIHSFVHTYKLKNAYAVLALDQTGLVHDFIRSSTTHPVRHNVAIPGIEKTIWNTYYLYQDDEGKSIFYVCGVSRTLLTQYILLALQSNLNLVVLTPPLIAHLNFYRLVYGQAFRRTQLAQDMQAHHNSLDLFFTYDTIARLLYIPTAYAPEPSQYVPLVTALGLFSLAYTKEYHEFHPLYTPA